MSKLLFFLCSIIIVTSCELHKQEASLERKSDIQTFSLNASEQMFAALSDDDYFKLRDLIDTQSELINIPNDQGQLLIIEAIKSEKKFLAHLLISHGADITLSDMSELSALDYVLRFNGHSRDEWQSVLNGDDFSQDYLNDLSILLASETSYSNQESEIKRLDLYIELGADVNVREGRNSLLMIVASKGLDQMVRYLCEREDIDINVKIGRYTALALIRALSRRNPELKKIENILLEYGAQ